MLDQALAASGVRPEWLGRMAENAHLSPALIEQAGGRATTLAGEPAVELEQRLERMLGNTRGHLPDQVSQPPRVCRDFKLCLVLK